MVGIYRLIKEDNSNSYRLFFEKRMYFSGQRRKLTGPDTPGLGPVTAPGSINGQRTALKTGHETRRRQRKRREEDRLLAVRTQTQILSGNQLF